MSEKQTPLDAMTKDYAHEILSAQQSAQLCQACGICCTGAFFSHVNITKKEVEALEGTMIKTIVDTKGKPVFAQPCPALEGTSCSIYEKRPGSCRSFLCDLTRDVLNGRTDYGTALEAVDELKMLTTWLVKHAPGRAGKRQAPADIKAAVEGIFSAWRKTSGDNVAAGDTRPPKALMLLLRELEKQFWLKQNEGTLTAEDREYITNAFAFTKLCDRLFTKNPLLRKYASVGAAVLVLH